MNPQQLKPPRRYRRKKTNVDIEAMEALMNKVLELRTVTLNMGTPQAARRLRFQFYEWRKREQDLNQNEAWDEVIARVDEANINFSAQSANPEFRTALRRLGIMPNG